MNQAGVITCQGEIWLTLHHFNDGRCMTGAVSEHEFLYAWLILKKSHMPHYRMVCTLMQPGSHKF